MKILTVIPTYNEVENLPLLVEQILGLGIPDLEILIVDDNSSDGTAAVTQELAKEYPKRIHLLSRPKKDGLGTAYVAGFNEALNRDADVIIQMDADLSHPPKYIPALIKCLKSADVVVGSRYVPGGGITHDWGILRRILSRSGDLYIKLMLGLHIKDTKSGFKAFRRSAIEKIPIKNLRSKGFIFQAEVIYWCQRMGLSIYEMPFVFQQRATGKSKMSLHIIIEGLWRPFHTRWSNKNNPL